MAQQTIAAQAAAQLREYLLDEEEGGATDNPWADVFRGFPLDEDWIQQEDPSGRSDFAGFTDGTWIEYLQYLHEWRAYDSLGNRVDTVRHLR